MIIILNINKILNDNYFKRDQNLKMILILNIIKILNDNYSKYYQNLL